MLTPKEWADHPLRRTKQLPVQFRALVDPGECDAAPADTFIERFKIHDILLKRFLDEECAVLKFTEALINSLDEASQRLIADPGGGSTILSRSLLEIVQILSSKYANVPRDRLGSVFEQLCVPFIQGTDVLGFLSALTERHRVLRINGEDVPEPQKIRLAKDALIAGGGQGFSAAYGNYEDQCRTTKDAQGYSASSPMDWEGFSDAMIAASQRLPPNSTVGAAGYGAGAVKGPADPASHDPDAFAAAVHKEANKRVEQSKVDRARRGAGGGGGGGKTNERPLQYCYSHGYQYSHTSHTCKNRWKSGHNNNLAGKGHGACDEDASTKGDPAGKTA
jgi:hypothetical protein